MPIVAHFFFTLTLCSPSLTSKPTTDQRVRGGGGIEYSLRYINSYTAYHQFVIRLICSACSSSSWFQFVSEAVLMTSIHPTFCLICEQADIDGHLRSAHQKPSVDTLQASCLELKCCRFNILVTFELSFCWVCSLHMNPVSPFLYDTQTDSFSSWPIIGPDASPI